MTNFSLDLRSLTVVAPLALEGFTSAQVVGPSELESPNLTATTSSAIGASADIRGRRLLVGATGLEFGSGPGSVLNAGGAFVYEFGGDSQWSIVAQLDPTPPLESTAAGLQVALGEDIAFVAAQSSDILGPNRGAVFVFVRGVDGVWTQTQTLFPPTPGTNDLFGATLSLDGDRLAIASTTTSRVHIFERGESGVWQAVFQIDGSANSFGVRMSLRGDRLVVAGANGYVAVYEKAGPDWNLSATLLPSVAAPQSEFGASVVLTKDGSEILVGAPEAFGKGAVFVFEQSPTLAWQQSAVIASPLPESGFGYLLRLASDRLLVTQSPSQRDVLFERNSDGTWSLDCELHRVGLPSSNGRALSSDHYIVGSNSLGTDGGFASFEIGRLRANSATVSTLNGGEQVLQLRSSADLAWNWFVLLGTASGTATGTPLPGTALTLPLNVDAYFLATLGGDNTFLQYVIGPLDANGNANNRITIPPGLLMNFIGTKLHHAWLSIDPTTFEVECVSNAVPLELTL